MQSGELDLYVGETSALEDCAEYKVIPLSTQSGVFFCRPDHPLLETAPARVEDLAAYPLATLQLPTRAKIFLQDMVQVEKSAEGVVVARPAIECEDLFLTKMVVANSLAVGLATQNVLRSDFEAGTLRELTVRGIAWPPREGWLSAGESPFLPRLKPSSTTYRRVTAS